jgi:deoxyribonuclease V
MPGMPLHPWNVGEGDARQIQLQLAQRVVSRDDWTELRFIAGVSVRPLNGTGVRAAVCVLDLLTLETIDYGIATAEVSVQYISGLRAFQEGPAIIAAFDRLRTAPDLILWHGHGLAHPRRCGLASHLGIWLNIPSIGVSEQLLYGKCDVETLRSERGANVSVFDSNDETRIGAAVRTRSNVRPIYVSIGHRVSLATAISTVMRCSPTYRLPEPLRQARRVR